MFFVEICFWFALSVVIIHYIIFPCAIFFISRLFSLTHWQGAIQPTISFIVAAYNEKEIIKEKILNDLQIDYPKELIEYIVVSDGSNDGTEKVVREFSNRGVTSIHQPLRQGKTAALNRGVAASHNDILVFSDANSMFQADALKKLVRHFADSRIGGVCGRKLVVKEESRAASLGDGYFWDFESILKKSQSLLGSISTADGEIFALRRQHYLAIPSHIINDDQYLTFKLVASGQRVIYDDQAFTIERASKTHFDDFNVKARMVYGGLQIISTFRHLLNPFKSWFAIQFHLHKTLRYFMWLLLILLFLSSMILLDDGVIFKLSFFGQVLFYLLAFWGFLQSKSASGSKLAYFPFYYLNVNLAALQGFLFFLNQHAQVEIWKKAER